MSVRRKASGFDDGLLRQSFDELPGLRKKALPENILIRLFPVVHSGLRCLDKAVFDKLVNDLLHGRVHIEKGLNGHDDAFLDLGNGFFPVLRWLQGEKVHPDRRVQQMNGFHTVEEIFFYLIHDIFSIK